MDTVLTEKCFYLEMFLFGDVSISDGFNFEMLLFGYGYNLGDVCIWILVRSSTKFT